MTMDFGYWARDEELALHMQREQMHSVDHQCLVDEDICWVTAEGDSIPLVNMSTSHLFNSVRMAWNIIAPVTERVGNRKPPAVFRTEVTDLYLAVVVEQGSKELQKRADMNVHARFELAQIMRLKAKQYERALSTAYDSYVQQQLRKLTKVDLT